MAVQTVNGEGPDNHLLGLREMARLHEKSVPLFEDKSYADFLRFRLSTSQVGIVSHYSRDIKVRETNGCSTHWSDISYFN